MDSLVSLLLVALGGAFGALGRYGLGEWARVWRRLPGWAAVLASNLLGCLLAGLAVAWLGETVADPERWRMLVVAGACGSLTTFSAFSLDVLLLWYETRPAATVAYVGVSILGGIAAALAGLALGAVA